MEKSNPLKKSPGASPIMLAAALALLGCTSAGYAATFNTSNCETPSHKTESVVSLRHYDATNLHAIDHVPIQDNAADIESLDGADPIDNDAATPFLYLTPRVASALREIFGSAENDLAAAETDSVISSPVAGSDDTPEAIESLDEAIITESIDDEFDRLIMQRQMFRTDI